MASQDGSSPSAIYDWDPSTPLPKDVKVKWVISPLDKYCPKAGWDSFLQNQYLSKRETNQQWRTSHGIKRIIHRLEALENYQKVKDKELQKKKRFQKNAYMPEALKELKQKTEEAGKVMADIWACEYDESKNPTLYRLEKDSNVKWKMTGIELSYDILYDLHVKQGHLSGTGIVKYLNKEHLHSWPRDMLLKFPMYCLQCRKKYVNNCVKRMLKVDEEQKQIYEEVIDEKKETIIRQGDLTVLKVWNVEELLIVSALDMSSSFLQHNISYSDCEKDLYESCLTIFSNTMFPRRFYVEVSQETKDKFQTDWDGVVRGNVSQRIFPNKGSHFFDYQISSIGAKLIAHLPDYNIEQIFSLEQKHEELQQDCFVDFMRTLTKMKSSSIWENISLASTVFNCNGKWSGFKNQLRDMNASPIELLSQESVRANEQEKKSSSATSGTGKTLSGYLNTSDPNPMASTKTESKVRCILVHFEQPN